MSGSFEAIAIGASAGAVEALSRLLPRLPASYPVPLMIVVHVPPDGSSLLVPLLQQKCALKLSEAEDKDPLLPGAYFAPSNYHLLVEVDRTLALSTEDEVLHSRPSIDVLFESAAEALGPSLLGIVLTGANEDGARGLKAIAEHGGQALAQTPAEAYAAAMPSAALAACPTAQALSLDDIGSFLLTLKSAST